MTRLEKNIIFDKIQGDYRTVITKDKYNLIVCLRNKMMKERKVDEDGVMTWTGNMIPTTLEAMLTMEQKEYYTRVQGLLTGLYNKKIKHALKKMDIVHMKRYVDQGYNDVLEIAHGLSDVDHQVTRTYD
tara:strand:- start:91 stop:477 length:387 start_codon:yes stop_codon:yes gene_type:complete